MDEILQLAVAYGEAWSQRNPEAIAALHTEDSVFHLHNVMDPYVGRQAIVEAAMRPFSDSPDLQFERVPCSPSGTAWSHARTRTSTG